MRDLWKEKDKDKNQESINQIALTLAKHFDSLYYVDIESGQYVEYFRTKQFHGLDIPEQGDDFFDEFIKAAPKCVHPDDIGLVKTLYDKITMLEHLSESGSYSAIFRLIQDGKIAHVQHIDDPIPAERKRLLDGLFGALCTIAGDGYVYLNDMRYDFSRWSLTLTSDFGLQSEYMYHADLIWQEHIHPEDMKAYRGAVDAVLSGTAELRAIHYRSRRADGTYAVCTTRGFVLNDKNGDPEYFGGIIITE